MAPADLQVNTKMLARRGKGARHEAKHARPKYNKGHATWSSDRTRCNHCARTRMRGRGRGAGRGGGDWRWRCTLGCSAHDRSERGSTWESERVHRDGDAAGRRRLLRPGPWTGASWLQGAWAASHGDGALSWERCEARRGWAAGAAAELPTCVSLWQQGVVATRPAALHPAQGMGPVRLQGPSVLSVVAGARACRASARVHRSAPVYAWGLFVPAVEAASVRARRASAGTRRLASPIKRGKEVWAGPGSTPRAPPA